MQHTNGDSRQYTTIAIETLSPPEQPLEEDKNALSAVSLVREMGRRRTQRTDVISVLLVDDHALIREGLRQLFALEEDLQIVGEASDGFEALQRVRQLRPDVVLMDVHMPVVDGIIVTRQIVSEFPSIAIIMLTIYQQNEQIVQALRNGAKGYLLKSASAREVADAIRAVHHGDMPLGPGITGALVNEVRRTFGTVFDDCSIDMLSEKEREIIRFVAMGMSNKEIANQLAYSEKTVKNYLSVIFQKLHLRDRTQVAIFALRHGLLPYD